jgi:hypothetical protein
MAAALLAAALLADHMTFQSGVSTCGQFTTVAAATSLCCGRSRPPSFFLFTFFLHLPDRLPFASRSRSSIFSRLSFYLGSTPSLVSVFFLLFSPFSEANWRNRSSYFRSFAMALRKKPAERAAITLLKRGAAQMSGSPESTATPTPMGSVTSALVPCDMPQLMVALR